MAEGWSLKQLHREILLSATWQQSSADQPKNRATDPENRLLWRMNRVRLSFEELRDSLLAAAGRLDTTIGGPPDDIVKNSVRRRTVFGTVDRMTMPNLYRYFDFPGADAHVSERHETIVAQQALYLMNNGFVMDQAGHAARRAAAAADAGTRVEQLYELVLGRSPNAEEKQLGVEFVSAQPAPDSRTSTPADEWRYGVGSYDDATQRVSTFETFPFFAKDQYKGGAQDNDPELGRSMLNGKGGMAGPSAVIRRWVAPRAGSVAITGLLVSRSSVLQSTSEGVRGRVVSSRHGKLGEWVVFGTEEQTDFPEVKVEAGDTIDFVVNARGRDDRAAGFTWAPIVKMDGAQWDAAKNFKAPAPAPKTPDVWQQFAQVLMEANEFTFLD